MPRFFIQMLVLFLGATVCAYAQSDAVRGVVQDASGASVAGAMVTLESGSHLTSVTTGPNGRFVFEPVAEGAGSLVVRANGFADGRKTWNALAEVSVDLVIVLQPQAASEQVLVSAERTEVRLSETPGSAVLLSTTDVQAAPALRVDDVLRQVPGFSLFRRSGSRTANASSMGVSLRGLGGTAASRALVLADGIPLVDPFGAWVYWDRIPRVSISSIEVVRGGESNLYGSAALGGVVQILTRQPEAPAFVLEASGGNENTGDLSIWAGRPVGKWDLSGSTEMFRADGFILVPDSERGIVDVAANSENATVYARIGRSLGANGRMFLRGNYYTEFRNNGTPIQTNDTNIGEGAAGIDQQFGTNDTLSARLYGSVTAYNQRFSSISANRNSEKLTDIQHVPEQVVGGGAQWTHVLGKHQTLIGGFDLNEVMGASDELLFSGLNQARDAGGRQRNLGIFGEDVIRIDGWTLVPAARVDDWSNFRGIMNTLSNSGTPSTTIYPDRSDLAFSPRLSVLKSIHSHVSVTGSVYRAFRAPTLNELYRTFRVGNALTLNNASLNAERLTGAEAGVNVSGLDGRMTVRGTFFWSDIVDPVENVTLASTPTLITRQKENLGRTRSRGVEIDGVLRVNRAIQISAGYAYTDATVVSYPGNPGGVDLVGLDVPQTPRNVFTWEARYWSPAKLLFSVEGRFVGRQFDDDQNQFPLDAFYTMNVQVGRDITRHIEAFAAIENLTNQRYEVAKTPITNLGPPILVRGGLRLNFSGK